MGVTKDEMNEVAWKYTEAVVANVIWAAKGDFYVFVKSFFINFSSCFWIVIKISFPISHNGKSSQYKFVFDSV